MRVIPVGAATSYTVYMFSPLISPGCVCVCVRVGGFRVLTNDINIYKRYGKVSYVGDEV